MRNPILYATAALMLVQVGFASKQCRFAPSYSPDELANNEYQRNLFAQQVIATETKFIREVGYNKETGLTIGAVPISKRTGIVKAEQADLKSSLQNEAIHLAVLTKALLNETQIYNKEESLEILKNKMQTLSTFTGRQRLQKRDKIVFWSVYGLLEVLETKYPQESDLIDNCILFLSSIERFVDYEPSSSLDYYFLPFLHNQEFKDSFILEQALLSKTSNNKNLLAGLYLIDSTFASIWHHNMLMSPRTQTIYGAATKIEDDEYQVDWESKSQFILGLIGGLDQYVAQRLTKEGKMKHFMSSVVPKPVVGLKNFQYPHFVTISEDNQNADFTSCRLNDLPTDFAWGVATAAYQIEGAAAEEGRGPSVWDDFCKIPGNVANGDSGAVADDFYHKYKEDVAMMKSLGIKNFRMSLSWSRILPNGTTDKGINGQGVAFYNYVINELIAAGITPWVTLHHWDTPSALHNKTSEGSFLNKEIVDKFNNYADFVFGAYGDRVKHWLTLNEPWTYTILGYLTGVNAPGRCSDEVPKCVTNGGGGNNATEPYIASHNMILAHAKAVQTYRQKYQAKQGGVISLTTNTDFAVPYNVSSPDDVNAASRSLAFAFGWYFDPIVFGKYPDEMTSLITDGRLPTFTPEEALMVKGSYDFIGLNHYTSGFIKDDSAGKGGNWFSDSRTIGTKIGIDGKPIGPMAQSTWLYVYPEGMRGILNWIDKRYNQPIIYVFENGVSVPGETEMKIVDAVHDKFRVDFYKGYIQNAIDAITLDGVNLQGYFGWSLMDNFEWADGYSTRFGMTYVEYQNNQKRYLKDSIIWYSQFTRQGASPSVNFDFMNPYEELHSREVTNFISSQKVEVFE